MQRLSHLRVLFRAAAGSRQEYVIDGGVTRARGSVPADLQGPEFAILDPIVPDIRARRPPGDPQRVLITLGARHLLALVAARAPEHRHVT